MLTSLSERLNSNVVVDNITYSTINMENFNQMLKRTDNVDFFLKILALVNHKHRRIEFILDKLDDDVISRLFWESLYGVNIVETILDVLITPAFIWCILNNKIYLINPHFRLIQYNYIIESNISTAIWDIANRTVSMILDKVGAEEQLTSFDANVVPTNHSEYLMITNILVKVSKEIRKFLSPSMELFLNNDYLIKDFFTMYKDALHHDVLVELTQLLSDLGYDSMMYDNMISNTFEGVIFNGQ